MSHLLQRVEHMVSEHWIECAVISAGSVALALLWDVVFRRRQP
jgi:hypothetical protein